MNQVSKKYRTIYQRCIKDPEFRDKLLKYLESLQGTKCRECGHIIGECY